MTLNRIVVLLTPIFSALSGVIVAWAANNLPGGPQLDETALTAVFIAGAGAALAVVDRWLKGWQKAEERTAIDGTGETRKLTDVTDV